jgi:hypothetical protein
MWYRIEKQVQYYIDQQRFDTANSLLRAWLIAVRDFNPTTRDRPKFE